MPYLLDVFNDVCLAHLNEEKEWICSSRNTWYDQSYYGFEITKPGTFAVIISPNPD